VAHDLISRELPCAGNEDFGWEVLEFIGVG
jgi:hypothetical protein